LQLKADYVVFDGFRIMLTRHDDEYLPRYDVIEDNEHVQVVVDIPGLCLEEDDYTGGNFSFKATRDKHSTLVISGKRQLQHMKLNNNQQEFLPYKQRGGNTTVIKRLDALFRQQSEFSFEIPLPQTLHDDEDQMRMFLDNGVAYILIPKKKDSNNNKKIAEKVTRSKALPTTTTSATTTTTTTNTKTTLKSATTTDV